MSAVNAAVAGANPFAALPGGGAATPTANEAGGADRFLKLLVTQLQNQDPMNPMDNAQITSQMAQINTVTGIEKLNVTVDGLNTQFAQLQALSGASLVGRDITVRGNKLQLEAGRAAGGFELSRTAGSVKVEVLNGAGRVVDTLDLGTQDAGRQGFTWRAASQPDGAYSFRVVATQGTQVVPASPLMRDRVDAVRTTGNTLTLETAASGLVAWRDVQGFN
jgi:flagellar basal-body rod modification protein FlgD